MLVEHLTVGADESALPPDPVSERDTDYEMLLDAMGYDPVSPDELSSTCGLTIDQVSSMLLILELEGKIEAQSGGRYSRLHR